MLNDPDGPELRCTAVRADGSLCGNTGAFHLRVIVLCHVHRRLLEDRWMEHRAETRAHREALDEHARRRIASLDRQKGSVTKLATGWKFSIRDIGDRPGERRTITQRGFATEREARQAMKLTLTTLKKAAKGEISARDAAQAEARMAEELALRSAAERLTSSTEVTDIFRQRRAAQRDRFVYYVRRPDGAIKIGTTWNMAQRMAAFRNVAPAELLAAHGGGQPAEAAMHRRFRHDRLDGEWFSPSPALLEHIAAINAVRPVIGDEPGARHRSTEAA